MECLDAEFLDVEAPITSLMQFMCENTVVYEKSDYGMLVEVWDSEFAEDRCEDGYIFPLIPGEHLWNPTFRSILYLVCLLYMFMGIAIIADIFMSAIEVITSQEVRKMYMDPDGIEREVKLIVWNPTVANLTLMALGSSAPEIILSVIETIGTLDATLYTDTSYTTPCSEVTDAIMCDLNTAAAFACTQSECEDLKYQEPPSDGLGAFTIVGSAAFNLLVIIAACVVAVPKGEKRTIRVLSVFTTTAVYSTFAYIWLLICLSVWTPDVVTPEEAIITFLLFPAVVANSYYMDKKSSQSGASVAAEAVPIGTVGMGAGGYGIRKSILISNATKGKLDDETGLSKSAMKAGLNGDLTEEELAMAIAYEKYTEQPHTRMHHRINACRRLAGRKKVGVDDKAKAAHEKLATAISTDAKSSKEPAVMKVAVDAKLLFSSPAFEVRESSPEVVLTVIRTGNMGAACSVKYQTLNGTADADKDFKHTQGQLHFEENMSRRQISIPIIEDNASEGNEYFYVKIFNPVDAEILMEQAVVTIVDNDALGTFDVDVVEVKVLENAGNVDLNILRSSGCSGEVSLKVTLCDKEAVMGKDYVWANEKFEKEREQVVVFAPNELSQTVSIRIIDDDEFEKDEKFYVDIALVDEEDMKRGAMIGPNSKCTITILNDDKVTETREKIALLLNLNLDKMSVNTTSYMQQFRDAISLDQSEDLEHLDYVLHFFSLGWKVLFATVPPTSIGGGWVTFCVALLYIAIMTMCVGDIAALFGCTVGLSKPVTAITFVALGTSLPDLFASMSSAVGDDYADAAVGNVTGSNAVNVYLGLGLPWLIGVLYHGTQGTKFLVSGGPLGFSVAVFTVCGVSCISTLYVRRYVDAELGGDKITLKYATGAFFLFLWFMYILLNILNLKFEWMGFPDPDE